jgi:hypothetical protein
MLNFLRNLFHKHNWEYFRSDDDLILFSVYRLRKCSKCGKTQYQLHSWDTKWLVITSREFVKRLWTQEKVNREIQKYEH